MEKPRRVTQKDIAKIAGVNRATVSMALHQHPSIPPATRERIQKISTDIGYSPDPMLTALATYRHGRRKPEFRGTLAWLAHTTPAFAWRDIPHFETYFNSAKQRAEFHGYRVETFDVTEMGVSWKRAAVIAKSRGIDGVLLCPQPLPDTCLDAFPWEQFTAVTFGYSIIRPQLNSVAPAQYRATLLTMRELISRGYRRIGFSINRGHDIRTDHNYLAGYLAARELHETESPVPVLFLDDPEPAQLARLHVEWIKRHRPDAIIACNVDIHHILSAAGIDVPGKLGVACPLLAEGFGALSGVVEDNSQLGQVAVDFLVSMLHRHEQGIPQHPQKLLVDGVWNPGRTIRPRPSD
ncbi:MAG TPA: LacI family DNA-binding transcriptional regulator [Rariglobus sp.]